MITELHFKGRLAVARETRAAQNELSLSLQLLIHTILFNVSYIWNLECGILFFHETGYFEVLYIFNIITGIS